MPPHRPLPQHQPPRTHRPLWGLIALVTTTGLLTVCTTEPTPTPTPTPLFATEDDAFAAAEQVYRDYNDVLNHVNLQDSSTFEPLFALTTGEFQAADRKTLSELQAKGYRFVGDMSLASFAGVKTSKQFARVEAEICIDVSESDVVDAFGTSVTSQSRPVMNPLRVTFDASTGRLLISKAERDESIACS